MDHLPDSDRLPLLDEIPSPEFIRRQSYSLRNTIEMPLEREHALRRPESAERAMRRRIRCYGAAADSHVRTAVRSSSVDRPARKYDRRQSLIRSAVQREVN